MIDGALIPSAERLWFETPLWRNLFENTLTVQFNHRMMAYLLLALAVWHVVRRRRAATQDRDLRALASLFVLADAHAGRDRHRDVALSVPIPLALLHQAMAIVVLTIATLQAARLLQRRPSGFGREPRPTPPAPDRDRR